MARINIEDSLFRDNRFLKLIRKEDCEYKAIGKVTSAWILAQQTWLEFGCIPIAKWNSDLDVLLEVGLAEKTENGDIYIKGSEEAFRWITQRSNAGVRSAERKKETRQKTLTRTVVDKSTTVNDRTTTVASRVTDGNGSQPHSLTLTQIQEDKLLRNLAPTSSDAEQQDFLPKNVDNSNSRSLVKNESQTAVKTNEVIAAYCDAFVARYNVKPFVSAADAGKIKNILRGKTTEVGKAMVQVYVQMDDPFFVKRKHDLATFVMNANKVAVAVQTGSDEDASVGEQWLREQNNKGGQS